MTLALTSPSATLSERIRALLTPTHSEVAGPGRVGAEIELLPVRFTADGALPVPRPDTLAALRRDPALLSDACVSFEPGGQLELSPPPSPTVCAALAQIDALIARARRCAEASGFVLLDAAVSPWHDVAGVALQTDQPRYRVMQQRFDSVGPEGRRMMRLTASLQVCVDLDPRLLRWRALNIVGPALSAAFAASPLLAGQVTGLPGTRSQIWQQLDPTRTGFDGGHLGCDECDAYTQFALGAAVMPLPREGMDAPDAASGTTLREWIDAGELRPDAADIDHHLTTLFPPVRPRGYVEVRWLDALPKRWRDLAMCTVAALCVDERALWQAIDAVPTWDSTSQSAWSRSARAGVRDDSLRATACQVLAAAAAGADRAPSGWLPADTAQRIASFAAAYTAQGRCPADELLQRFLADPMDWSTWT